MFAPGSISDPLVLAGLASYRGLQSTVGRTEREPRLRTGENTFVGIVAGQSNSANYATDTYSPTNAGKVDNLNVFDGGVYAAAQPLLGCEGAGGNWMIRCADKMIAAGMFARVIWVPLGLGGSPVAPWKQGGELSQLLTVAFKRCAALGLPVSAVLWQQGEADNTLGTSQAQYLADLQSAIAGPRLLGFNAPWFVAKGSYVDGSYSVAVRTAQTQIVNGTTIFAGADTDTLGGANRSDGVHLSSAGCDANATLWKNALDAVF
jgi:hypothetical protein